MCPVFLLVAVLPLIGRRANATVHKRWGQLWS
jgi:hypothetical protein